eukprot:12191993-Karenia_brevis.AAC.1
MPITPPDLTSPKYVTATNKELSKYSTPRASQCIHMHMHRCMLRCTHVHAHACKCMHVQACNPGARGCMHMPAAAGMHMHVHAGASACTCMHVHGCARMHTHPGFAGSNIRIYT